MDSLPWQLQCWSAEGEEANHRRPGPPAAWKYGNLTLFTPLSPAISGGHYHPGGRAGKGVACRPVEGAPAAPAASSLGGPPWRRSAAQALSPTVLRFHIEAESQVLVTVQQPAVTGCCHVQHQPALVPSSERLKIQKEQVRLPVDTKEQLTEGRHSCLRVSSARLGDPEWGVDPPGSGLGAPCASSHCLYRREGLLCRGQMGK